MSRYFEKFCLMMNLQSEEFVQEVLQKWFWCSLEKIKVLAPLGRRTTFLVAFQSFLRLKSFARLTAMERRESFSSNELDPLEGKNWESWDYSNIHIWQNVEKEEPLVYYMVNQSVQHVICRWCKLIPLCSYASYALVRLRLLFDLIFSDILNFPAFSVCLYFEMTADLIHQKCS